MSSQVTITDVSPRDGLQTESTVLSTETKIGLVNRLVGAGIRRVEVTSFAHPLRVPQMADAERVVAGLPELDNVVFSALVLNEKGLMRALETKIREVNFVIITTDAFSMRNQGVTTKDSLEALRQVAALAKDNRIRVTVTLGASFGCPYEGEVKLANVLKLIEQIENVGPASVTLADTIGVAAPGEVKQLLRALRPQTSLEVRCHFHNTRNTGYANAFAAFEEGVTDFDASCGGVGGCPFAPNATGNIATEDLVYALERSGIRTGLDLDALIEAGRWLSAQLGQEPVSLLDRSGRFPPPVDI